MAGSLREQLIGAWELIEYCAYLPDDESNKKYPMGPKVQGVIMYTPDGYMSAQLLTPDKTSVTVPSPEPDGKAVENNYGAYTGPFYLDETGDSQGPVLLHNMKVSNLPSLLGDTQRRLVKIVDKSDGRYLILSLGETTKVFNEDRMIRVTWKRMPKNEASKPPHDAST